MIRSAIRQVPRASSRHTPCAVRPEARRATAHGEAVNFYEILQKIVDKDGQASVEALKHVHEYDT